MYYQFTPPPPPPTSLSVYSFQVLDPKDMCNPKVDDLSVMTYLAEFPKCKVKSGAPLRPRSNAKKVGAFVAERSSLPDSSSGVSSRMWVRIPALTLVSLSKTLNHNCFSPPRG